MLADVVAVPIGQRDKGAASVKMRANVLLVEYHMFWDDDGPLGPRAARGREIAPKFFALLHINWIAASLDSKHQNG